MKKTNTRRDIQLWDCVRITWRDSFGVTDTWEMKEDLESMTPSTCTSVGFVIEQESDYITICGTQSEFQVLARLTIPRRAITNIEKI